MMTHDVKDDPIPLVSSQEPSIPSKYGLRGWGVLVAKICNLGINSYIIKVSQHPLRKDDASVPFLFFSVRKPSKRGKTGLKMVKVSLFTPGGQDMKLRNKVIK